MCGQGCGWGALGLLLRRTELPEAYVWGLLLVVALLMILLVRRRPSQAALRKGFVVFSLVWFAGLGVLAVAQFKVYQRFTREDQFIEWLTADFLLAAAAIGFVAARRAARRRPAPVTVFLAGGYFCAFLREIEWGEPFYGDKVWYSRHLFFPRAYIDPSYFHEFRSGESIAVSASDLYLAHVVSSAVLIVLAALGGAYLIRHRRGFLDGLRQLPRTSSGRYFALGVGAYCGAQILGKGFEKLLKSQYLIAWRGANHVGHRILDEPLELWAAACFLMSVLALWNRHVPAGAPLADAREDG